MKAFVAAMTLSLISLPVNADSWLCIGEQQSFMSGSTKKINDPASGVSDNKYIVDENSVKNFDEDGPFMTNCSRDESNLMTCSYSIGSMEAVFNMNEKLVFMLITKGLYIGIDSQSIMVEMGRCSKISD